MRDQKRLQSTLPSLESLERIKELTAEINTNVLDHTSNLWKEVLDSIEHRANPSNFQALEGCPQLPQQELWHSCWPWGNSYPSYHPQGSRQTYWSSTMLLSAACLTVRRTAALSVASTTSQLILLFLLNSLPRWCLRASSGPASPQPDVQMGSRIPGPTALRVLADIFNLSVKLNTISTLWKGKPSFLMVG